MIGGGNSLKRLLTTVTSCLCSQEVYAEAVGHKKDVMKEISGPSGKATGCTKGEACRMDDL